MHTYLSSAEIAVDILKAHITLKGMSDMEGEYINRRLKHIEELKSYLTKHYDGILSDVITIQDIQVSIEIRTNGMTIGDHAKEETKPAT